MTEIKQGDLVCITFGRAVSHERTVEMVSQYPPEEGRTRVFIRNMSERDFGAWYTRWVRSDECPQCNTIRCADDKTR